MPSEATCANRQRSLNLHLPCWAKNLQIGLLMVGTDGLVAVVAAEEVEASAGFSLAWSSSESEEEESEDESLPKSDSLEDPVSLEFDTEADSAGVS